MFLSNYVRKKYININFQITRGEFIQIELSMALSLNTVKLVFFVFCKYILFYRTIFCCIFSVDISSFFFSVRMFPLLIQFVLFKKITVSMKVHVKHNNTVHFNIKIKCILICKIYYHSKIYCSLDMNLVQKLKNFALIRLLILLYLMH